MSLLGTVVGAVAGLGAEKIARNAVLKVLPETTTKLGTVVVHVGAIGITSLASSVVGKHIAEETDGIVNNVKELIKKVKKEQEDKDDE